MSASLPGRFPVTLEPGCVSPGVTGQHWGHSIRGIMRMIPATDRM